MGNILNISKDKNRKLLIFTIVLCYLAVLSLLIIILVSKKDHFADNTDNTDNKYKPYAYFDCYLTLTDINPQFVNAFMKFDNQHVSNGSCKNSTLHMIVNPCAVDSNGMPSKRCGKPQANLTSSQGNPLEFPLDITLENISKFFGINTAKIIPATTSAIATTDANATTPATTDANATATTIPIL